MKTCPFSTHKYILKVKILTFQYIKEIFQRYSNEKISSRALTQTVWAKKNNVVVLMHICIRSFAAKLNNFVAIMEKKNTHIWDGH